MDNYKNVIFIVVIALLYGCNGGEDYYNNPSVVVEYLPAPGQYINDIQGAGFDYENTMTEAIIYANNRISENKWVSLGGFGGYIVFKFERSIHNDGGYNLQISGNATEQCSEPGIVWVMKDDNSNGDPDDIWYELKGSEYGEGLTEYTVIYYRPENVLSSVIWSDNLGNNGIIEYNSIYHSQDSYYPNWITSDSYALTGTCLVSNNYQEDNGNWINGSYDWGYADNYGSVDMFGNNNGISMNHFRISDAVDNSGKPVMLDKIDFVKIQTGVNSSSGWLGEISTEIYGVDDYNLLK